MEHYYVNKISFTKLNARPSHSCVVEWFICALLSPHAHNFKMLLHCPKMNGIIFIHLLYVLCLPLHYFHPLGMTFMHNYSHRICPEFVLFILSKQTGSC